MFARDNSEFNDVMDSIYASFMRRKGAVEGKLDSLVRDPLLIINIARQLDLLPLADNVIRVTGSKGKGTTSRMIDHLMRAETGCDIGLFVSPEEFDHNDRMRINGSSPTKHEFIELFRRIQPDLLAAEERLTGDQYLSPFGIFLLMALQFFRERGAKYQVLEGGRGARYDEVGQISSRIAVITSILFEHPKSLGPGLEEIAVNKLHIGTNARTLVCDKEVAEWNSRLRIVPEDRVTVVEDNVAGRDLLPRWFAKDAALARASVISFLGRPLEKTTDLTNCSASFGVMHRGNATLYYDACISRSSLDTDFIKSLLGSAANTIVLASLPDDKDREGIRSYFDALAVPYYEMALSGTRGYLHYDIAKAENRVLTEIHYEDVKAFLGVLTSLLEKHDAGTAYLLGTQTYIRLVKLALGANESWPIRSSL